MLLYINKPWDTECNVALNTRLYCRDDSRFAPSQWETPLLCNNVSHWLGASLESGLILWLCWYAITNLHANPCVLYLQPWDLASGHNLQLEPVITATLPLATCLLLPQSRILTYTSGFDQKQICTAQNLKMWIGILSSEASCAIHLKGIVLEMFMKVITTMRLEFTLLKSKPHPTKVHEIHFGDY